MATMMQTVAGTNSMLQFMKLIGQLKRVPRTGWVYRNVKKPESVSDHMYRMAMMSLTITDPTVDKDRCIKLALVHDMAECIVGDIAPSDNISKAEKHRREEEAMRQLSGLLPEGLKQEIYGLWEEYETQSSPEARLVKQFDLLEMILQAHEYEELEGTPGRLQEFFDSTNGRFHHPDVLQLVSSLNEERGCHMTKTDGTKNSGNSQTTGAVSSQPPHTTSHTS
ncbi:HD domain-containing protein 2 [Seriola lalandi dorsalis]|uniref:5'-deoxynucleotidase HDDC2 n=1 Tax=Seriola lalandi dorsalis TaxID=1841481 RepID=A0A3B4YZ12_SERLL|nr:HD domain-containing protein 2 [Seriola lalandi dorsalis]XP_056261627.1 HD domain-containing protein 2 [Seriola aureovittata]